MRVKKHTTPMVVEPIVDTTSLLSFLFLHLLVVLELFLLVVAVLHDVRPCWNCHDEQVNFSFWVFDWSQGGKFENKYSRNLV